MNRKYFHLNSFIAAVMFTLLFYSYGNYAQSSKHNTSPVIAFVSDTQEPMILEKLWLKVIILNSNFSDLSNEEISQQQKWYEEKLRELDRNPSVRYIIVGTHHSPYTNSKIVEPSGEVQRLFVPAFLKTAKCKLFVSGHAHTFEHFRNGGKDFIVIGGGGGLLHPFLTGQNARFEDLYAGKDRTFHYVTIGAQRDSLVVRVKMINKDFRSFGEVFRVGIGG